MVRFALRSSLHPELACGVLGVGSMKVDRCVSGAARCGGQRRTCFRCWDNVCELVFSACENISVCLSTLKNCVCVWGDSLEQKSNYLHVQ
jgi:hypothetical protein